MGDIVAGVFCKQHPNHPSCKGRSARPGRGVRRVKHRAARKRRADAVRTAAARGYAGNGLPSYPDNWQECDGVGPNMYMDIACQNLYRSLNWNETDIRDRCCKPYIPGQGGRPPQLPGGPTYSMPLPSPASGRPGTKRRATGKRRTKKRRVPPAPRNAKPSCPPGYYPVISGWPPQYDGRCAPLPRRDARKRRAPRSRAIAGGPVVPYGYNRAQLPMRCCPPPFPAFDDPTAAWYAGADHSRAVAGGLRPTGRRSQAIALNPSYSGRGLALPGPMAYAGATMRRRTRARQRTQTP